MATMKELEKMRIEKIQSLTTSEIENYVDVLVTDICKLHDFSTSTNPDERLNEINDLYNKLKELGDLTESDLNRVKPYIKDKLNSELVKVNVVNTVKDIVDSANLKNYLISLLTKNVMNQYVNLQFHLVLFHGMFKKLNLISETADVNVVNEIKDVSIMEFQKIFPKFIDDLKDNIEKIDDLFYSDDVLIADIDDMKKTLTEISESDDDLNVSLKKYGIVETYSRLINAYINHMELKKFYNKIKANIIDLIESENAFLTYSKTDYESLSDDISFDEFMKSEVKFNLIKCELWK